ncbi:hypothetical protein RJ640_023662 [Escallonia rubra]|uniref:Uncharacterized protein n=1 Tax=Escallonia rubra TaxID=112253 RepID=A0AA88QS19_9ASTE|nr:hypothetical protein RJ640_023662 [Escallonia rubra]
MGRRSSTEYAKLPLIPTYLQPGNHQFGYGANFASAGAGALDETLPGLVINLNTQLAYFKDVEKQLMHKLGDEEATQLLSKAVYFFSIGGNDYASLANYSGSHDEFVEMVIGNMTVVIKEIYEQGGRNFGFLGVAAVGCLPVFRSASGHCNEELATLVKLHNEALHNILHKLDRQLKGFRYSYFDFYTVSLDLIENPSKYGLKEGKSACCGSGPYRGINSCGGKRGIAEYKLCANATTGCLGREHGHDSKHVPLFIFGDSFFDAGNNNYINTSARANFWPYGETFFKYPTGRFCDGRLIPDFIAEYAKLPLIPPYLQPGNHQFGYGANFASAGAGALDETHPGRVINLNTQLTYFKDVEKQLTQKLGDEEATQLLSEAVYLFSIGNNDYGSLVNYSGSHDEYVGMVIGNMTIVIKEVYRQGGRNFGILGVDAVGCVPALRNANGYCMEELATLVKLHNEALHKILHKLEKQLKGFTYSYFDFYTVSLDMIDNPFKYGLNEGKSACCGLGPYRGINSCGGKRRIAEYKLCTNASEYVFFDSGHPTEAANDQIAKLIWSGNRTIAWPYNLKKLFKE